MINLKMINLKRAYDPARRTDGTRHLRTNGSVEQISRDCPKPDVKGESDGE